MVVVVVLVEVVHLSTERRVIKQSGHCALWWENRCGAALIGSDPPANNLLYEVWPSKWDGVWC